MSASESVAIGPGAQVMSSASRAASAWWKVSAATATPVDCGKVEPVSTGPRSGRIDLHDSDARPASPRRGPVVEREHPALDVGRSRDDGGLRVGRKSARRPAEVHRVLLRAGDDRARVLAAARRADDRVVGERLQRERSDGDRERSGFGRELSEVGAAPPGRRVDHQRLLDVSAVGGTPQRAAAAVTRRRRAFAATVRAGSHIVRIVDEPPVIVVARSDAPIAELDVDAVVVRIHLLGDHHRERGRDALALVLARQLEAHAVVGASPRA